eukprot:Em0013g826a
MYRKADDLATVQIPTTWRALFLDTSTLQLFFTLFHNLPAELASQSIACLVQMASVRRSLFNNVERQNFLSQLVKGVRTILELPQALADPECYHEFCRLLMRLKSNYQLVELMRLDDYPQFIELVAKFTVSSLQSWQFSANSIHYLLGFWQRLVGSVPYIRTSEPHLLDTYVPEITEAYATSRLESVETVVMENLDNPLDDKALVSQQLEQMSTIGRCEYNKTCQLLINLFDRTATSYQELLQRPSPSEQDLAIREGQLAWLVYLIASVIGGRVSHTLPEDYDCMDGQLVCRVLQLMTLTDAQLPQVYQTLSERLGLTDESMVLNNVFITKIVTNLKYWTSSRHIVNKTLQLLNDLALGYGSVRKLVKLESVQFILDHHTPEHFAFLDVSHSNLDLRCRTTFYTALGRLLLVDLGENEESYPRVTTIVLQALAIWYHDPIVTTPILKLMAELVLNRSQRLQFEVTSPNGVLLFREASKAIACYGEQILTVRNIPEQQVYQLKYPFDCVECPAHHNASWLLSHGSSGNLDNNKLKGVSICFNMLKAALCGNYVNFGVLRLYGDSALDEALNMFVKLLISIPLKNLLDFPKVSQAYYGLLEILTQDHMDFISSLQPEVFVYILSSISEGLSALGCCSTLDHILSFLFKKLSKLNGAPMSPSHSTPFLRILELHPEILQQMLSSIMNTIIFENCRNQWSMSRPLLGLILLNEDYFQKLRDRVVEMQPAERVSVMAACFDNLMEGIERNLQPRNRDNFTKNLSVFRRDVNCSVKDELSPHPPSMSAINDMMV